jgi:polygalacturonase
MDNSAGNAANSASGGLPAAHNSDGFDISGTTNMVLSNTFVSNQDDCVAVTSGTNITVTGMTCTGGHGLSIGSVGGKSDNVVTDVTFSDSTVTNSQNGCRIKTNSGTTGTVSPHAFQHRRNELTEYTDYQYRLPEHQALWYLHLRNRRPARLSQWWTNWLANERC